MAGLPYWSTAVTVMVIGLPAMAWVGLSVVNRAAGPRVATAVGLLLTARLTACVSAAVTINTWLATVSNVTLKTPAPLLSVASAGSTAWLSLLVKWTVPV